MSFPSLAAVPIDSDSLRQLYPLMQDDFPPSELKPLSRMEWLMTTGQYEGWCFTENDTLCGYALLLRVPGRDWFLLDYFAMLPNYRGSGYGSSALRMLKERYTEGIFLEAEDPTDGNSPDDRMLRLRRTAFYRRAGFYPVPFANRIFGVRYLVHLSKKQTSEPQELFAAELLREAYSFMFDRDIFSRHVHIY